MTMNTAIPALAETAVSGTRSLRLASSCFWPGLNSWSPSRRCSTCSTRWRSWSAWRSTAS